MSGKGGKNDRYVVKHPEGYVVKKAHADRASTAPTTQIKAEKRAKEIVGNLGGGEVRVQGRNGRFRDSDTVPKGKEGPTKDTKH